RVVTSIPQRKADCHLRNGPPRRAKTTPPRVISIPHQSVARIHAPILTAGRRAFPARRAPPFPPPRRGATSSTVAPRAGSGDQVLPPAREAARIAAAPPPPGVHQGRTRPR